MVREVRQGYDRRRTRSPESPHCRSQGSRPQGTGGTARQGRRTCREALGGRTRRNGCPPLPCTQRGSRLRVETGAGRAADGSRAGCGWHPSVPPVHCRRRFQAFSVWRQDCGRVFPHFGKGRWEGWAVADCRGLRNGRKFALVHGLRRAGGLQCRKP